MQTLFKSNFTIQNVIVVNATTTMTTLVVLLFIISGTNNITAQTTTWQSSNPNLVSVDNFGNVKLEKQSSGELVLITTETIQNDKTIIGKKDILVQSCTKIGNVCWANANLTYDPSSCISGTCSKLKIADSKYDRGLFFQWYGGNGTNNVIIGYPTSGTWNSTPRYVQPGKEYGFPNTFPRYNQGSWIYTQGYNSTNYAMTEWTGNNPCSSLGNFWRLPTYAELKSGTGITVADQTWQKPSGWYYDSSNGGGWTHTSGLWLSLSGWYGCGGIREQGSTSFFMSSTQYNNNINYWYLAVNSSNGMGVFYTISCDDGRSGGHSVRCVSNY